LSVFNLQHAEAHLGYYQGASIDTMRSVKMASGLFTYLFSESPKMNSKLQPTRCNVSLFIYFYRRSTCFRRFLYPSSGARNCTYSFRYCQPILLLTAIMNEMEPSISSMTAASSRIG